MALRWWGAEPPAHFLLGLRKCCLRQRLPAVGWGGVKWGGVLGLRCFYVSREAPAFLLHTLITGKV